jgi:hypothetical protein
VLTERLVRRVRRDFAPAEAETVLGLLDGLGEYAMSLDPAGRERVQTAVVLLADGDSRALLDALALAQTDWRDVLVAGGLAHGDWPERVSEALGP